MNEGKLTLACGIINFFLDLLITTLPTPMVLMLKNATAPENPRGDSPKPGFCGDNSGHRQVSLYNISESKS